MLGEESTLAWLVPASRVKVSLPLLRTFGVGVLASGLYAVSRLGDH